MMLHFNRLRRWKTQSQRLSFHGRRKNWASSPSWCGLPSWLQSPFWWRCSRISPLWRTDGLLFMMDRVTAGCLYRDKNGGQHKEAVYPRLTACEDMKKVLVTQKQCLDLWPCSFPAAAISVYILLFYFLFSINFFLFFLFTQRTRKKKHA